MTPYLDYGPTANLRARADAKAADLAPIIKELWAAGKTSLKVIAAGLNDAGVPTARGWKWSSPQVMRMLERHDPFREEEADGRCTQRPPPRGKPN